jgi:release factor glutamine methyltransferase
VQKSFGTALADARQRIELISTSPGLDAQLLLAAVTGTNRAHVIAHRERILTENEAIQYEALVSRRANGEPVAYLLGQRAFYDRDFVVTPAVLIPRPETEHLLERALAIGADTVVDCGTGSGALAVTFAANRPSSRVYATDISPEALAVARQNANLNHAPVEFLHGDLLNPLIRARIRVDLVMANLPYITSDELADLMVSRHEPRLALDGGTDGLNLIRRLLDQCPMVCRPGATVLLEIGATQGPAVTDLARDMLKPEQVTIHKDYAGHDRVVEIRLLTGVNPGGKRTNKTR